VTLSAAAQAPGAQVRLASSNPQVAQLPQLVTIPAGQTSVGFAGTASAAGQTTVTATLGTSTLTAPLTVTAAKPVEKTTDKVGDKVTDKTQLEKVADVTPNKTQLEKVADKVTDKGVTRET
jgi:hypothetical protein